MRKSTLKPVSLLAHIAILVALTASTGCNLVQKPEVSEETSPTRDQGIDEADMQTSPEDQGTSPNDDMAVMPDQGVEQGEDMPANPPDQGFDDMGQDMPTPECDAPAQITAQVDARAQAGDVYTVTPTLAQGAVVRWSKLYGPDDLTVNTSTGELTWEIPRGLPMESFHVGVQGIDACGGVVKDVWVVTVGGGAVLRVGVNETHTTIRSAFMAATAGDTILITAGAYDGPENSMNANGSPAAQPPSGTSQAFTTVIAEEPGEVVVADGIYWLGKWGEFHHVAAKGFYLEGGAGLNTGFDESPRPHHIKFVDIGAEMGFSASHADDVLVEGCYAFGDGRYKLSTYKANRVIFRRCVTRLDHAPLAGQQTPFGSAVAYSSDDVVFQNVIDIDSDQIDAYPEGELTGAFSVPTTSGASQGIVYERSIVLNNAIKLGSYDATNGIAEVEYRDIVAWDFDLWEGIPDFTHGFGQGTMNHMTIGAIRTDGDVAGTVNGIFNGWGGQRDALTNSFLSGIQLPLFYQIEALAYNAFNDVSMFTLSGAEHRPETFIQVESRSQVLTHLPRVVSGSALDGAAEDGGAIGATVMTFVGRSGTFHGEPGWDEETSIAMWPFPHEDTIGEHMRGYRYEGPLQNGRSVTVIGNRGFAQADALAFDGQPQTLTTYIWEYLGAPCPQEICRAAREQ